MSNEFLTFNKSFMYVIGDEGDKVDIPSFVAKAFNRHRYDITNKELQMKCLDCDEWIPLMQICDGVFKEIEGTGKVEKIFTRDKKDFYYNSRCKSCKEKKFETKAVSVHEDEEKNSKYSLYLKPSNKEYIEFKAAALGLDIAQVLNKIIEKDKTPENIQKLKDEFAKRVDKKFKL